MSPDGPHLPPRFPLRIGPPDAGGASPGGAPQQDPAPLEAPDQLTPNPLTVHSDGSVTGGGGVIFEDGLGIPAPQEPIAQFVGSTITDDPANTRSIISLPGGLGGDLFVTNDAENWIRDNGPGASAPITPGVGMALNGQRMIYIGAVPFVNGVVFVKFNPPGQTFTAVETLLARTAPGQFIVVSYINGATIDSNAGALAAPAGADEMRVTKNGNNITTVLLLDGVVLFGITQTLTGSDIANYGAGVAGLAGISGTATNVSVFQESVT